MYTIPVLHKTYLKVDDVVDEKNILARYLRQLM